MTKVPLESAACFSSDGELLSFHAMAKEMLTLRPGLAGGVWLFRPTARRRQMHRHDELEFNLVVRGQARYLMTDRRYDLKPGTLIWLFPACDHVLLNESADFEAWIVVFGVALVNQLCRTEATASLREADPAGRHCLSLSPDRAAALVSLCRTVADRDGDPDFHNAALGYLLMAAWDATRHASALDGADVHPAVERAARALRDDPTQADLPALAGRVGLSESRLSRLFREQTGLSITDYRNQQRVDRFVRLYRRGGRRTMLEAALEAGFGSYAQFHRVFSRQMSCGPADYRRRLRDGD